MNEPNPYKPPAADVGQTADKRVLGPAAIVLLALLGIHVVIFAFSFPQIFGNTRVGILTGFQFIFLTLNTLLLIVGGALLVARSRASIYVFGTAVLVGLLSLTSFNFIIQYVGIALSIAATGVSIFMLRRP